MPGSQTAAKKKPKKSKANSCRHVRIYPSREDAKSLKQWFGCVRKTYNWVLGCYNDNRNAFGIKICDYQWLRKRFVTSKRIPKAMSYLLDTPKHVRDTAVKDLAMAFITNFEKRKKDPTHTFDISFRSKKKLQSINLNKEAIKSIIQNEDDPSLRELKVYPKILTNTLKYYYRTRDRLLGKPFKEIQSDCKLILDELLCRSFTIKSFKFFLL